MRATIKSEFRKLFTIRSTYIIIILSFLLVAAFMFYFEGFRGNTGSPASVLGPNALREVVVNAAGMGVLFVSIIAILFMAHEYRYNMITYTLTANTHRTKVLLAKLLTIVVFGIGFAMAMIGLALGSYMAGLALRGVSLPAQDINMLAQLGQIAFYYAGYALLGILIAVIVRSVVMAIATLLILSTTVEPLLSLVLKDNAKYLPIAALDSTVGTTFIQNALSVGAAIAVSSIYLGIALVAAWLLFVRRDAT